MKNSYLQGLEFNGSHVSATVLDQHGCVAKGEFDVELNDAVVPKTISVAGSTTPVGIYELDEQKNLLTVCVSANDLKFPASMADCRDVAGYEYTVLRHQ